MSLVAAESRRVAPLTQPIPTEALAHHIAFLGKTGSGKSNAAKTVVEGLLDRGERVCVIDPTGAWYGLRLDSNGKPSPYPVVIFGGLHADVQIGRAHGAAVAEVIAGSSTPAVIDTRLMTVGERTEFFTAFAQTLLRRNRGPLHLVIDEAHVFAPQGRVSDPKSGEMLHAANNLVSLGRSIGLRIMMLSQRPAKLHKDSLTQVETLVAMRVIAPHDVKAIEAWIGEWADAATGREVTASLPSLPTGDAWIWSPELGVLSREHFALARTYDSGKAPSGIGDGPTLQPIDLDAVNAQLERSAADIKASDPKALKAEVARLTRELSKAQKAGDAPAADPEALDAAYRRGKVDGYAEGIKAGQPGVARLMAALGPLEGAIAAIRGEAPKAEAWTKRKPSGSPRVVSTSTPHVPPDGTVPAGCAKPLATLAAVYPSGLTEAQWATAAGYKRSGGTWGTYKSRLRGAGLIEQREGRWFATQAGADASGDVETPPAPGADLVRWWAAKLPGTSRLAEALIEAWPADVDRDDLANRLGMSAAGGSYGTYLSRLAGPGLIERSGRTVRLTDEAMGPRS